MLFAASLAKARPGESQSVLEDRLLENRRSIKMSPRDVDAKLEDRSNPYKNLLEYFPDGVEQAIYFKPAEGRKASQEDLDDRDADGWYVYVVYLRGRSVFEAYQRVGSGISRYEQDGLLTLNKGQSYWVDGNKVEKMPSAFGYSFVREDKEIFALRKGSWLLFYMPEFDQMVYAAQQEIRAEKDAEAKDLAPDSLRGF